MVMLVMVVVVEDTNSGVNYDEDEDFRGKDFLVLKVEVSILEDEDFGS